MSENHAWVLTAICIASLILLIVLMVHDHAL